jgi:hypothetical protein
MLVSNRLVYSLEWHSVVASFGYNTSLLPLNLHMNHMELINLTKYLTTEKTLKYYVTITMVEMPSNIACNLHSKVIN